LGKPAWAPPINPADISGLAININIVGRGRGDDVTVEVMRGGRAGIAHHRGGADQLL
jgi:hypothetical protein